MSAFWNLAEDLALVLMPAVDSSQFFRFEALLCVHAHTQIEPRQGAVSQTPLSSTLQLFESWLKTYAGTLAGHAVHAARFEVGQCVL